MNRLFNYDNPVMQFIGKIFDIVVLNIIFIFACIPVFTTGAALCGLYYVCLKMVRGEDPYIWKYFWQAFRQNFKQATLAFLFFLAAAVFLWMDFYIINTQDVAFFSAIRILLWAVSLFLVSMFLYIFPVISHFVCTTKQAFKNAALMAIGHLPYTLVMLAVFGLIVFLCTATVKTFAMVVILSGICGFSVVAFTYSICFDRIFKKYEPEQKEVGE